MIENMINANMDINAYQKKAPDVDISSKNVEEARKAAEDFESFFISQMFQHMFTGIEPNSTFGGGHAEKVWKSFLVDEYGKMTAKSGGIGIADSVMSYMLKNQEA